MRYGEQMAGCSVLKVIIMMGVNFCQFLYAPVGFCDLVTHSKRTSLSKTHSS